MTDPLLQVGDNRIALNPTPVNVNDTDELYKIWLAANGYPKKISDREIDAVLTTWTYRSAVKKDIWTQCVGLGAMELVVGVGLTAVAQMSGGAAIWVGIGLTLAAGYSMWLFAEKQRAKSANEPIGTASRQVWDNHVARLQKQIEPRRQDEINFESIETVELLIKASSAPVLERALKQLAETQQERAGNEATLQRLSRILDWLRRDHEAEPEAELQGMLGIYIQALQAEAEHLREKNELLEKQAGIVATSVRTIRDRISRIEEYAHLIEIGNEFVNLTPQPDPSENLAGLYTVLGEVPVLEANLKELASAAAAYEKARAEVSMLLRKSAYSLEASTGHGMDTGYQ